MSNQSNEITVGQFFGVVRRSLKRGLIYILATAVVLLAVLLPVKSFTDKKVYSTTISFTDITESMLSKMDAQKAFVVNEALKDKNDSSLNSSVLENLSVSAKNTTTGTETDANYIPTTYEITLKASKKINFSSGEYKNVLDSIANAYIRNFSTTTVTSLTFNYTQTEMNATEYLGSVLDFADIIEKYSSIITNDLNNATTFEEYTDSNGYTAKDLLAQFTLTRSTVERLKTTIISNKLERTSNGLESYISLNKNLAESNATSLKVQLDDIADSIEKYSNIIGSVQKDANGNNIYVYDDTNLVALMNKRTAVAAEYSSAIQKRDSFQTYLDYINNTTTTNGVTTELEESKKHTFLDKSSEEYSTLKTTTEGNITTIFNSLNSTVTNYNALVNEYLSSTSAQTNIVQTEFAHSATESSLSNTTLIILLVIAILIAYIVAFTQTYAKLKANGYFVREKE